MNEKRIARALTDEEQAECTRARVCWEAFKAKTGTTQKQMADKMSLSQGGLNGYLNGYTALNTDFILKFALITGTRASDVRPSLGEHPNFLSAEDEELLRLFGMLTPEGQMAMRTLLNDLLKTS